MADGRQEALVVDTLTQDLRHALRMVWRNPGFALAVVLTLGLGIGANTAIFSVVDGVLLRPAPVRDLDRLVMVWETDRNSSTTREPASIPDFRDFERRSDRLARLAALMPAEVSLTAEGADPARLAAVAATHHLLPLLGIRPLLGRSFTEDEDQPGAPRVAMISEALWARHFDRDSTVVGRAIRINDVSHTIVGIQPSSGDFGVLQILGAAAYGRGFADRGGRPRVDAWLPLRASPAASRDNHPIFVVGRLRADASVPLAQEELGAIAADLERDHPENDGRGVHVEALARVVFGPVRPALLVLLGAVALVLLVACANVANLLLVRGEARTREVQVRVALGATASRLARQFIVESATLTVAGALLGLFTASLGLDLLLALAPASLPRVDAVGIDARVLVATLGLSAMVALAFGILPTRQAWRRTRPAAVQADSRGTAGRERHRVRSALVVTELTLSVMLMVGAGLLIRSLWRLQAVDPGFVAAEVLKAEYELPASRYPRDFSVYPRWTEVVRFTDELPRRAAALPGVAAVTIAGAHPLDAGFTSSIRVVGRESEARGWPEPAIRQVDASYFETVRLPLVTGRRFTASDDAAAAPVVLVNQAARRRFFAGGDPVGQQIFLWGASRTVVGVVGDERFRGLDEETPPGLYLPRAQAPTSGGSVLLRVRGDPATVGSALRRVVRELDPALPLFGVEPLARTLADSMGQRRFTMLVLGAFAAMALVLAAVGVHGVLSYTVAQRTREIGIRLALGANLPMIRALVVRQGAYLTGVGLTLGLLGALAASRALRRLLYGVGPFDPATFAGVALILGAVAMLACWLPARRATRVDPMDALRAE